MGVSSSLVGKTRRPRRKNQRTLARNSAVRGCSGALSTFSAVPASTTRPASMKTTVSATSRAKPISCGDDDEGRAGASELLDDGEHLADQLGIERGGRLVEEQSLGLERQRAGNRDALLLAAGKLARIGVHLVREADAREQLAGRRFCLGARARRAH